MIALLGGLSPLAGAAGGIALDGAWRPAAAGEVAAAVATTDARLQRFDPAQLHAFPPGEHGCWVLLRPASGQWPPAPWVLEVKSPGLQQVTLTMQGEQEPRSARLMQVSAGAWPAHGQLAFPLASMPAAGAPLRLLVDARGVIPSAMSFAVVAVADHLRGDADWLAFASACLAIMAAMAVMAAFFALRLRDPTFAYYAVFVLAYALILALQAGYAFDPLDWQALAAAPRAWGRIATALTVVFAILFLDRFADLRRHARIARTPLLGYACAIAALATASVLPLPGVDALARMLVNPLLIVGGPLLLGASVLAACRGSRHAVFFLLGWTPLLAVTVLGSLQLYGVAPRWTWSDDAALGAGAFEALVLSLGLADRSLALRRDRDLARRLANIDPLTGLYNRRAWSERLLALEEAMRRRGQPLSVMFLDLDRFKALNDRFGHGAGDAALRTFASTMREELREQDKIGRYGGEEFVIALPGADGAHSVQVAERIRGRLQQRARQDPHGANPTVSIGVATMRVDEDMANLLRRADEAMYAAKAAGRNRIAQG